MGIPLTCNGTIINNSDNTFTLVDKTTDGDWVQAPPQSLGSAPISFKVEKTVNLDFSVTYEDDDKNRITCSGSMHKGAQANKFEINVTPSGKYGAIVDPEKTRDNPAVVSWTIA